MKSLTYFEQLEKIIYKSILKNNKEMLIFLKTEEKKEIAKLSIDDLNNLLDQLFNSHQFLQTEKIPTDTLIINQFEKNICLKRLINIIIDNILSYNQLEICFSSLEEHYLAKEGLLENSVLDDCIAFRTDYIERVIGRIFESKDIPHNKKQKVIRDLFFVYSNLEEDKEILHNTESSNILAKRFDMIDYFFNNEEKKEIYVSLCLENMLTNIESNTKNSNKNNTLASIQVESMLAPLSIDTLMETKQIFDYDIFNCNINIKNHTYYEEVEKVFKKLLVNNINK